ncbi:MAG: hypothetical protein ABIK93_05385 [candidate division WOR-3 bacterium]
MRNSKLFLIISFCFLTGYGYRPRLVFDKVLSLVNAEVIRNPEVTQIFYGELVDQSDFYKIKSDKTFDLYLNILVPDDSEAVTDFCIEIYGPNKTITINGGQYDWEKAFDRLTGNNYLKGPSYEETLEKGEYLIQIYNSDNQGKYILVIGENDVFSIPEMIRTILLMPKIKSFMGKPFITVYFNQVGVILLTTLLIVAGIIILLIFYRQSRSF